MKDLLQGIDFEKEEHEQQQQDGDTTVTDVIMDCGLTKQYGVEWYVSKTRIVQMYQHWELVHGTRVPDKNIYIF